MVEHEDKVNFSVAIHSLIFVQIEAESTTFVLVVEISTVKTV